MLITTTKISLTQAVLRYAGFLQSFVAFPCMLGLTKSAFGYWSHCYDLWYYFTSFTLAASACAAIVFIAAVQRKATTTSQQYLHLETIKTILATGMFLWTNFVVGHLHLKRQILTGLAVVVLFYAPFWYAYAAMKKERVAERLSLEDNRRLAYIDYPEKETLLQNA